MKNKKIYAIILILIVALGLYYYLMLFKDRKVKLSVQMAGNFTEYKSDLPLNDLRVGGTVNTVFNEEILRVNGIVPYEFDAYVKTNWGNYKNKYVGYKLTDFLKAFKNKDYKFITAYNVGGVSITYPLDVINNDSVFIVFYKDGEQILKGKVAVISVSEDENYFIENVVRIDINDVEVK